MNRAGPGERLRSGNARAVPCPSWPRLHGRHGPGPRRMLAPELAPSWARMPPESRSLLSLRPPRPAGLRGPPRRRPVSAQSPGVGGSWQPGTGAKGRGWEPDEGLVPGCRQEQWGSLVSAARGGWAGKRRSGSLGRSLLALDSPPF